MSIHSCWVLVNGLSISRLVAPIMVFRGVRISWLMLARNSDVVRLASNAASRAALVSYSRRLRSMEYRMEDSNTWVSICPLIR